MSGNIEELSMHFFIDSNIWLYAFITGGDELKQTRAKTLIQNTPNIVMSTQVVNEVSANLIRKAGFTESEIQSLITSFYQQYTIIPFGYEVLISASRIRDRYAISFWDSLLVASALQSEAITIYSEDMHDGLLVEGTLRVINPFKR